MPTITELNQVNVVNKFGQPTDDFFVHRLIGDSGASVISRVMGLILASVAVDSVLGGITTYFSISVP